VFDSELFGKDPVNTVKIYNDGEEIAYDGPFSKSKITKWINTEGYPLIEELAQPIWQRAQTEKASLIAVFVSADKNEADLEFVKTLARKFKGEALFSYSYGPNLAQRWGSSGNMIPTSIVVNWKGQEPKMVIFNEDTEEAFTEERAEAFVREALAGTYKSYRKSEPIPEDNSGPVTVIVGKNFEEIVYDKTKNVLVEFYAPWCGHCKKLAPIFDELGERFADNDHVVIAKIDATANGYPEDISIQGFPTIIFFPAGEKTPMPYSGQREVDDFVNFVNTHSVAADKEDL